MFYLMFHCQFVFVFVTSPSCVGLKKLYVLFNVSLSVCVCLRYFSVVLMVR
jgi:hypothetical protein